MTIGHRWLLFAIVSFAFRAPQALTPAVPTSDAADYQRLAIALRQGVGFVSPSGEPTAFRPPLYPFYLAVLGPTNLHLLALAGAALGALSCCLAVLLGRAFGLTELQSWLGGGLLAIDPVHQVMGSRLLSETLFQPLLLAGILLAVSRPALTWAGSAGAIMGLGLLTRAAALPAALFLAFWIGFRQVNRVRAVSMYLFALGLAVSPWLIRNWVSLGAPVMTTQGGVTLYSSYNPPEGRVLGVLVQDETVRRAMAKGEVAGSRDLTRAAWHGAWEAPADTLRLALLKIAFFWAPVDWEVLQPSGRVSPVFLWVLPLCLLGVSREPGRFKFLLLLFVALTAFSAVAYGSPRLRLPYEPLLFLPAARVATSAPKSVSLSWAAACFGLYAAGPSGKEMLAAFARAAGWW